MTQPDDTARLRDERIRRHMSDLDVAAIPTKPDVFTLCGRPARELHDDLKALLDRIEALEAGLRKIAANNAVPLSELPNFDQPNGWRLVATDAIDIARALLEGKRGHD